MKKIIAKQSYIYRYKNDYRDKLSIETIAEKIELPSDHFPLVLTLKK